MTTSEDDQNMVESTWGGDYFYTNLILKYGKNMTT